ncbi:putative terminase [Shigella boydii 965-58]|nr:putative terminase [Shigella boydii 965-58]
MLVKLAVDQRTLKAIYSKELKAAKKRELLPFWLPWVNGVLPHGTAVELPDVQTAPVAETVNLWE